MKCQSHITVDVDQMHQYQDGSVLGSRKIRDFVHDDEEQPLEWERPPSQVSLAAASASAAEKAANRD